MNNRNSYLGGSYLGAGYNPYYQTNYMSYQPPIQQPQMQSQPTQLQDIPFSEVRYGTRTEAESHIVAPGRSAMFINRNLGEFYIKSANQMGEPFFEEFTFKSKSVEVPKEELQPNFNTEDFVKKEQLNDLLTKKDLEDINKRFDELNKKIRLTELIQEDKPNGL